MQFLSAEADKEYARSKCLRHMNLQTVIIMKKILTGAAELSHGLCAERTNAEPTLTPFGSLARVSLTNAVRRRRLGWKYSADFLNLTKGVRTKLPPIKRHVLQLTLF
ncbi:MAG: hypothetical protein WB689_03525 [Xanthobacteraceae bacterium]